MKLKKAGIQMWLVELIVALVILFVILFIVAKSSNFNNSILDFFRGII